MLYFSYGSNMSIKRIKDRVPSASFISTATLCKHDLRFHKRGKDGSAKCDAFETGYDKHAVIGVVFDISESEKPELDHKEGLGYGYEEKLVQVKTHAGEIIEATTYYATKIDPALKPYHWYKQHVLVGARGFDLPDYYVASIANIEAVFDPVNERHKIEMSIYAPSDINNLF